MKQEELLYWLWFSKLKILSCLKKKKLLDKYKSPEKIWKMSRLQLEEENILNENEIQDVLNKKNKYGLDECAEYIKNNKIYVISIFDELYPKKLRLIYESPIVLYAKGNVKLLNRQGIGIVGTRECSNYGKKVASELAYEISKFDKCIISGLARGVDSYAHIGALRAKGKTIGVIGNGIDEIYPKENKLLADTIITNGGLILSEYIIGTKPEKMNFPARNRIISGLSDGVVVVEAGPKSGALITSDFALEQGKEVFAVPGNIKSFNSIGTNELIKQGANVVTCYKDIIDICYGI